MTEFSRYDEKARGVPHRGGATVNETMTKAIKRLSPDFGITPNASFDIPIEDQIRLDMKQQKAKFPNNGNK
jgi:hypothetical protein